MRIVYFGTPAFAVPPLRRLAAEPWADLVLVVTQPDRPAGRGRRIERSAVGSAADGLGLPVYQPASLRDPAARRPLADARADLFLVAAFGLIFGPKTLALPPLGCLNLHASLLPRYRGASPIPAAILSGDDRTGVTLMRMAPGLDTGPIVAGAEEPILPDDTSSSLTARLADLAARLAAETLPGYAAGALTPTPQESAGASLTRPLVKADGWLAWERPALELERRIRALWPWPRAWTTVAAATVQVHRATVVPSAVGTPPGTVLDARSSLTVACGRDALRLDTVQPAGGRAMSGRDFAAGQRLVAGARVGLTGAPPDLAPLIAPAPE